jgi:AcrR family transcriptional regulator
MPERNTDRRIHRTRRLIRDAFSELMEEKGFEAITVTDITKKADINRGTFYLHYQDKYDLLEQSEDEILNEIQEITISVFQTIDLSNFPVTDKPFPFVIKVFEYFQENAMFLKAILGPKGTLSFRLKLKEVFLKNLSFIQKHKQKSVLVPEEYFISYVAGAHIGVFQQWLEGGMKETPEEMALFLSKLTGMGPAYVARLRNSPGN